IFPTLSGFLFSIAWQSNFLFFITLLAFTPFLCTLDYLKNSPYKLLKKVLFLFTSVFLFNAALLSLLLSWSWSISWIASLGNILIESIILFVILLPLLMNRTKLYLFIPLFIIYEFFKQYFLLATP